MRGSGLIISGDHSGLTRTTGKAGDGQRDGPNVGGATDVGCKKRKTAPPAQVTPSTIAGRVAALKF